MAVQVKPGYNDQNVFSDTFLEFKNLANKHDRPMYSWNVSSKTYLLVYDLAFGRHKHKSMNFRSDLT